MTAAAILPSLGLVPEIAVAAMPCRRHYGDVGLGADYVDQFIR